MRPTPVRFPDHVLAPVCGAFGFVKPFSELSAPERAMLNARYHAQINPNPRVRRVSQTHAAFGQQVSFGFDDRCVDLKRRQANDFDKD